MDTMKVRDLLKQHDKYGDVNVYDDYDCRCQVLWFGQTLTKAGEKRFKRALDLTCDAIPNHYGGWNDVVVRTESEKDATAIYEMMRAMAGYCTVDEYDTWIVEGE